MWVRMKDSGVEREMGSGHARDLIERGSAIEIDGPGGAPVLKKQPAPETAALKSGDREQVRGKQAAGKRG
jgi:hypothetical protein